MARDPNSVTVMVMQSDGEPVVFEWEQESSPKIYAHNNMGTNLYDVVVEFANRRGRPSCMMFLQANIFNVMHKEGLKDDIVLSMKCDIMVAGELADLPDELLQAVLQMRAMAQIAPRSNPLWN